MKFNKNFLITFLLILFVAIGVSRPAEMLIQHLLASISHMRFDDSADQHKFNQSLKVNGELKQLEQENSSLRKALKFQKNSTFKVVNAYVTGRSNSFLLRYLRINKGSQHGLEVGQIVLADGIVIGKINSVTKTSSKIILNEDQNFRLEVEVGGDRGLLKGFINGVVIDRILPNANVKKNDLVVTVAQPNKIPAGLPVGRVVGELNTKEEAFKQFQITGYEDAWRAYLVQVVINEK